MLGRDGTFGLAGWQWVFIAEAAPAVILGFAVLIYLRDRPAHASWRTAKEKEWLAAVVGVQAPRQRAALAALQASPAE